MRFLLPILALFSCASSPELMTDSTPQESIEADWDFYPCQVDDAPASIFLNLALRDYARTATESTLYALHMQMLDPGSHGMGNQSELDTLGPVEDSVTSIAARLGARFVGRIRNNGNWQLTFMGPEGLSDELSQAGESALDALGRECECASQEDADWNYYLDFLYPSPERMRWIQDRRVVDSLASHGDDLSAERRVNHFIYFETVEARESFLAAISELGFEHLLLEDNGLQIHRVDSVQLDAIHALSEELNRLVESEHGSYDGWETSVEK